MFFNETLKEIVGEPGAPAPLKKADPFSLDSLIAWLEKQPGADTYCYTSTGHCLIARYLRHCGIAFFAVGAFGRYIPALGAGEVPTSTDFWRVARDTPHTFSAALSRARALRDTP